MTVEEAFQTFKTAPILFVGSGFSKRYGKAPDWKGLLQQLAAEILPDHPFAYEKYLKDAKKQVDTEDESACFPMAAELMKRDFDDRFFDEPEFATRFQVNATDVRNGISPFLCYLAGYFSRIHKNGLTQELQDELSDLAIAAKHSVDGVITTNYDGLLEDVFKDFQVYIGQKDMLTENPTGCMEIYKIHGSYSEPSSLVFTQKSYDHYRENAPYLYAKLLAFFIEHPILFLGYSLKDPDIRAIFASLAKCLNPGRMQSFLDNMIFIQYDEQVKTPAVKMHSFDFGSSSVNMKCIQINSYGPVFKALVKIKRRYDVRKLRQIRQDVYRTVVSNEPKDSVRIISDRILENEHPHGDVMGFTLQPKYENVYDQLTSEQVYANIILSDPDINLRSLVKDWLPKRLARCEYPVFYYARKAQEKGMALPSALTEYVDRHQTFDSFLSKQLRKRKAKRPYNTMEAIAANDDEVNVYQKVALLDATELAEGRLRGYLLGVLETRPECLNSASLYSTDLKRLFRMLDFLENSSPVLQKLGDGTKDCALQEMATEPVKKAQAEHLGDPHEAPSEVIKA